MDVSKNIDELRKKYANHHFTHFLNNKKVIVVGPDTSLIGKNKGNFIDSFDVVVRHNTVFDFLPFNDKLKKDYGSKTDILYLSPTCIQSYSVKLGSFIKMRKLGIKYICYQNGNKDNIYLVDDYYFPKHLENFKRILPKYNIKMHYCHYETISLTNIMTNIKNEPIVPRTGFISIYDIFVHNPKSIDIIGMSFYNGGGHSFRPDVTNKLHSKRDHKGNKCPHDSDIELDIMKCLIDNYQNIQMINM